MAQDPTAAGETTPDCEVMASIDGADLVIAALCREDAWLSAPLVDTLVVDEWR
jgi:hypothetical protein